MVPEQITGFDKIRTDLSFARRAFSLLAKNRSRLGELKEARKPHPKSELERQRAFLKMLSTKKYARFGDRIFFDMYVPSYPGPGFDRMIEARLLGFEEGRETPFIPTVDIAVTDACMYRCDHCYAIEALNQKNAMSLDEWKMVVDRFQEIGTGAFSIVGGEPLLRFDDLCRLIEHGRDRSDMWVVTTGFKLTTTKAKQLKDAGLTAAAVSLDHYEPDKHNEFRKSPKAFDEAAKAVALFNQAGVFPCLVVTATRDVIRDGGLMKYMELAHQLGAGIVEIFDPIAAGAFIDHPEERLRDDELYELQAFQKRINTAKEYAHLPAISTRTSIEDAETFGCGAGGNNFIHVDPSGNLVPCPMLSMSTGNVLTDGFDVAMGRMRKLFPHATAHGPQCPANLLRDEIREAQLRTGKQMLPYEESCKICSHFPHTDPPTL
ncbi:MAG: radical SAM protein [Deltaproteobacteria bacterium]|jgi:MoaA/NifB/PqqE/SkfB family radical SAM enzyme